MSETGSKLPRSVVVSYGLPGLAFAMLLLPPYVLLPVFYTQTIGLPLYLVGLVVVGCRVFDAFTDPVIGVLSDRTRSRLGRRRIWIVFAVPLTVLMVLMLFVPPENPSIWWFGAGLAGLTLSWTMLLLPYSAWGAELSPDYNTRTMVVSVREGMGLAGTLIVVSIPAAMTAAGYADPELHMNAVGATIVVALLLTTLPLLSFVPDPNTAATGPARTRFRIRDIASNAPFRRLVSAYLVNSLANGLPATLFILFVGHVLGLPDLYGPLLLAYFVSALAAIPFWFRISKVLGKHRTWAIAMIFACIVFSATPLVVQEGEYLPFLIITVLTGLAAGADFALPSSIQADVIDVDTLHSGSNRAGLFFAIWGVVTKLSFALAALSFPLLDWAGFDASALDPAGGSLNPEASLSLLVALYAILPVALKLVAIAIIWRFPLGEAEHRAVRQQLEGN